MTALPLPDLIAYDSAKTVKHRTLKAQFGDGYSQRAPDGINSQYEVWAISWPAVTASERDTITAALNTAGSASVLTWTPPDSATEKKYLMGDDGYSVNAHGGGLYTINCTLTQVFEP